MEVFVLAVLWGAYLLPPLVRQRVERQPTNSVHSFKRQLRDLGYTSPGRTVHAHEPDPALLRRVARRARQRRRLQVLRGLGLALVTTLVLGVTMSTPFLVLHGLVWAAATLYVSLLISDQRIKARRRGSARVTEIESRIESGDVGYSQVALRRAQ